MRLVFVIMSSDDGGAAISTNRTAPSLPTLSVSYFRLSSSAPLVFAAGCAWPSLGACCGANTAPHGDMHTFVATKTRKIEHDSRAMALRIFSVHFSSIPLVRVVFLIPANNGPARQGRHNVLQSPRSLSPPQSRHRCRQGRLPATSVAASRGGLRSRLLLAWFSIFNFE
jgi:hypothetical protein